MGVAGAMDAREGDAIGGPSSVHRGDGRLGWAGYIDLSSRRNIRGEGNRDSLLDQCGCGGAFCRCDQIQCAEAVILSPAAPVRQLLLPFLIFGWRDEAARLGTLRGDDDRED